MSGVDSTLPERLAKIEAVVGEATQQYRSILPRLDAIMEKLSATAVAQNDILHLKEDQVAQWKKIDLHKMEWKEAVGQLHSRIDTHMAGCSGPAAAMQAAIDAKRMAEAAQTMAEKANNLPGKMALAVIVVLVGLISNVSGGVILYFVTNLAK